MIKGILLAATLFAGHAAYADQTSAELPDLFGTSVTRTMAVKE